MERGRFEGGVGWLPYPWRFECINRGSSARGSMMSLSCNLRSSDASGGVDWDLKDGWGMCSARGIWLLDWLKDVVVCID